MIKYLLFKYLRLDKSQPFIYICKLLAFFGVGLGVCVLLISMAVMNGMNKNITDKLMTMNYAITLYPWQKNIDESLLNELKSEFDISPFIQTQAAIKANKAMRGAVIFGVDFEAESKINSIFAAACKKEKMPKFSAILGQNLADRLYLNKDDKFSVIFTDLDASGFAISPKIKRFTFANSFYSGLNAYDLSYVFVPLNELKKITKKRFLSGIHIDSKDAKNDLKKLKARYGKDYQIIGWWEQNGNFLSAMALEKRALFFILLMLVIIAALNIISSLFMLVLNRRSEIALLLAMGASKKEIRNAFFVIGAFIGICGIIFGIFLGAIGIFVLKNFDIISLPADVYGFSRLPVLLSAFDFFSIIFGALIIVLASAIYPAIKAANLNPLETLRNE